MRMLDTIDLQDQSTPSAQDHTRQPTHPAAIGAGPPAPHQAEALRELAAEEEESRSTDSSDWANGGHGSSNGHYDSQAPAASVDLQQQDTLAIAQNGGLTGSLAEDADMADAEGDDSLDEDDMMDKISSSPSIDDGGLPPHIIWPARLDSLSMETSSDSSIPLPSPAFSSSPYLSSARFLPLQASSRQAEQDPLRFDLHNNHHQRDSQASIGSSLNANASSLIDEDDSFIARRPVPLYFEHLVESYDDDFEDSESGEPLAVLEDFDQDSLDEDDENNHQEDDLMVPYENTDEDNDDDFPYPEESRFIDSGWGGECLQDTEDIDFEFVYALHTFVATVEGQANATKGDTMVLLDDSNSYWWLVRVVKDSSIGKLLHHNARMKYLYFQDTFLQNTSKPLRNV
jgi:hypothetical protein